MSNSDVRIPRPTEGAQRRTINIVAWTLGLLFVAVAGLTYFALDRAEKPHLGVMARYPGVTIYEKLTPGQRGRAQRVVVEQRKDQPGFVQLINSENADTYANRGVEVTDGMVVDVIGDQVFTMGPSREESIIVRINKSTDCVQWFKPGQRLRVDGVVKSMPEKSILRKWGVNDDEKGLAGHRRVYLEAENLEILDADPEERPGC